MSTMTATSKLSAAALAVACSFLAAPADAAKVRVTITNLAPAGGVYLTPFWVGFHSGNFDTFDLGTAASPALQRLSEDGDTQPLSALFTGISPQPGTGQDATITEPEGFPGMPVFDPGNSSSQVFDLDPATEGYFSFASMVIPSNDAFIGNDNPQAYPLFDQDGNVKSFDVIVNGSQVLDAGTEQNTETDAAFFDQTAPDTGTPEDGVVAAHPGYNGSVGNPTGMPVNILGGTNDAGVSFDATAADFTREGAPIARIHVGPAFDGSLSGSWYDPARSGEGLMVEVFPREGGMQGVVTFYTFAPDGSGQVWIQGIGALVDDTLTIDEAYITTGPSFGPAFDPADVDRQPWGTMTLHFDSCATAEFAYSSTIPAYGDGSHSLIRLTPVQVPGACT